MLTIFKNLFLLPVSFWQWRRRSPRPSLWQWIRGFRSDLWWIEGREAKFIAWCREGKAPKEEKPTVSVSFKLDEMDTERARIFFHGDDQC